MQLCGVGTPRGQGKMSVVPGAVASRGTACPLKTRWGPPKEERREWRPQTDMPTMRQCKAPRTYTEIPSL